MKIKVVLLPPVEVFLRRCDPPTERKILRKIKLVEEFGLTREVPDLKKVTGTRYWEVRVLGKVNARVFLATKKGVLLAVHGFIKKSRKTNKREIDRAERVYRSVDL